MQTLSPQAKRAMAKIFNLVNMAELPALSDNVHELLDMIGNPNANARQLSTVILKDVSLTSKILQVVNSAYYTRGIKVGSVSRAITLIGFSTIRELAMSIALFEDFIAAGGDQILVGNLLTNSYLSGSLAKNISQKFQMHLPHEEAFICSLFYNLGELIVLIYLPDIHRRVEAKRFGGIDKNQAARTVLNDLTYYQIGMEVAMFWNLGERIVNSMHPNPPRPRHPGDEVGLLMNLSAFCNQLTEQVDSGGNIDNLIERFGGVLPVTPKDIFRIYEELVDSAGNVSEIIRAGIRRRKLQSKLIVVARTAEGKFVRIS